MRSLVIAATMLVGAVACGPMTSGGPGHGGPGGAGGPQPSGMEPARPVYLNPGTAAVIPGFTSVLRAGNSVYVSGQVALNDQGDVVGAGDLAAQARLAFTHLGHMLQIAGALPEEVLRINVFVVNLKSGDWEIIRREGATFFPARNPPVGTLVGVSALPKEGLLIAIDATAVVRAEYRPVR
jgi:enamine deaminase RidA (YjgF/YER057c/UK114 family)